MTYDICYGHRNHVTGSVVLLTVTNERAADRIAAALLAERSHWFQAERVTVFVRAVARDRAEDVEEPAVEPAAWVEPEGRDEDFSLGETEDAGEP